MEVRRMLYIKFVNTNYKKLDIGLIFQNYFSKSDLQKISIRILINDAEPYLNVIGKKVFDLQHNEVKPEQFPQNLKTLLMIMMVPIYVFDVSDFDPDYCTLLSKLMTNCDRTVQTSRTLPISHVCQATIVNSNTLITGTYELEKAFEEWKNSCNQSK